MTRYLLAALCLPSLALAQTYDGVYRQVANADCALVGVDGGSVKIEDGIFYGVETQCRMTNPVDVIDMDATLYTMQCTGEDQVWTERAMIMNAAGDPGILIVWNGYAFKYDACEGPVEEVAAETE